jgi:hypothetical protein
MRAFFIPTVLVGLLAVTGSDEPSEATMRAAFATTLSAQVQSALDFVAETGGPEALDKVRAARTDEFEIRSFTKLDCALSVSKPGHFCEFTVRVAVVGGLLEHTMTGRFYAGPRGLVFVNDDPAPAGI